jgi:cytochrome c-type biogenesis protein CcmH
MLFWICAAILTVAALLLMFWPIIAGAGKGSDPSGPTPNRRARRVLLGLSFAAPMVAVAAYLADGRPDLPDRPYAKREAERIAAGLPSDRERALVRELAARMERHPEQAEGWAMLGHAYMREARFEEAAAAFQNALSVKPGDPSTLSALGEALTLHANGEVTPAAEGAFAAAIKARPTEQKARFFLALGKAQRGHALAAKEDLTKLLHDAPPDAPWRSAVEAALARVEQDLRARPPLAR